MNGLGLERNLATPALQAAALSGLLTHFTAALGTVFRWFDEFRLLAEQFGNHISRDLIHAQDRLFFNRFEIGCPQIGEPS